MARWEPDAAGRLRAAAFALFEEQGFERTTVAQIAERAGVNRRTFFHHFADKGEVAFGQHSGAADPTDAVLRAPSDLDPMQAAVQGLQRIAEGYESQRDLGAALGRILASSPELRARELVKRAGLVDAVREALRLRGADAAAAEVAAWAAVAVFFTARDLWHRQRTDDTLAGIMAEVFRSYTAQQRG